MLAVHAPLPKGLDRYAAEVKWDGQRLAATIEKPGTVALYARSGSEITNAYPELAALAELGARAGPLVLDGEVVALDPQTGKPSFALLQRRMGVTSPSRARTAMRQVPVVYMVFDALVVNGSDVTSRPYWERRTLLESLALTAEAVITPPAWVHDADAGIGWTREQELEGVVLKRLDSPYLPGTRSRLWIKHKYRAVALVVIGGWLADEDGQPRTLLVGSFAGGDLRYRGAVGSGLSRRRREQLLPLLAQAATDGNPFTSGMRRPPPGARWVRPLLEGEVGYAERTPAGLLRQPTWRGLRGVVE